MALLAPEVDLVLSKELEEDSILGQALATELGYKGFCTVDVGLSDMLMKVVHEDITSLRKAGKFYVPPHQVKLGLLGTSGSGQIAELEMEPEETRKLGEGLLCLDESMDRVAMELSPFVDQLGFDFSHRTPSIIHQHVRSSDRDDGTPLVEKEVTKWLTQFTRHKVMIIIFLGPGSGILDLKPIWEFEADEFSLPVKPGMVVILRPDVLSHTFASDGGAEAFATSNFLLMGRPLRRHTPMAKMIPPAMELDNWVGDRIRDMKDSETQDSEWNPEIPREWQLFMNHTYFKAQGAVIAVRGIAGRFPNSWDTDSWFTGFPQATDYAIEVPITRWDHKAYFDADPDGWKDMKVYCQHGCFTDGVDLFDPRIFGISPAEAKTIDPNQRMVLETGYDALCRSGYKKNQLMNMAAGMYAGFGTTEWDFTQAEKDDGAFGATGVAAAIVSNRLSFCLGMKGPSMTIDTEASSSMTALYMAVEGVQKKGRGHATELSLAQGVHLMLAPVWWPSQCASGWLAKEGRTMSFNATADGFVRCDSSVGCVLKPLTEPVDGARTDIRDEDQSFVGVLASCVMNHNGAAASLTAPNGAAEQENVADAIKDAQISILDVDSVEAHAQGGFLADAVELGSLVRAHRLADSIEPLLLTAMKTNCGNSIEASGMAAFFRTLVGGERGYFMPSVHLNQLNPHIVDYDAMPYQIATECCEYKLLSSFAGTMSRGFGGTNVCAISFCQVDEMRFPEQDAPGDADLVFWPGGGGKKQKAKLYTIRGSFNKWEVAEPMVLAADDSWSYTLTLGEAGFEEFQILLDDNVKKVLHPEWPYSKQDAAIQGPEPCDGLEGGQNWIIDGRGDYVEGWFSHSEVNPDADILEYDVDNNGRELVKQAFFVSSQDSGSPGDKYKVVLKLAGKWRSVMWKKL